jgi:hypothetical protein
MSHTSSAKIPPHVLSESLSGEMILLDMSSGMYFGLSTVATRFWQLLAEGSTPEQIESILLNEFDVDAETLHNDLATLVEALEAKKLLQRQAN